MCETRDLIEARDHLRYCSKGATNLAEKESH